MSDAAVSDARFAVAIFCDDIRFEVGGKVTLVGVYNGDMYLLEFPQFIPKLTIWLQISTPIEQPFESLHVRVEKGESVVIDYSPVMDPQVKERPSEQDTPVRGTVMVHLGMPPMTISEPCTIRVIVTADGVQFNAGKLHIGKVPRDFASDSPRQPSPASDQAVKD